MTARLRPLLLAACLLPAAAGAAPRPPVMQVGELPGEKLSEPLQPKERNPFTRREVKAAEIVTDKESEESKLRALFATMSVTGVIRGTGATKVLLGSLILKEGYQLPPLLKEQTERLVVGPISDTEAEIDFIEGDDHTASRKILVPIDLHPRVPSAATALPAASASPGNAETASANGRPSETVR